MDELFEIQQLGSKDIEIAKKAWDKVEPLARKYLLNRLMSKMAPHIDCEAVTNTALTNIWKAREGSTFETVRQWKAYLFRAALSVLADEANREKKERLKSKVPYEMKIGKESRPLWPFKHTPWEYADALWLQADLELSKKERRYRVLAAQLFYLHKKSWQETVEMVSQYYKVDRQILDAWLEDQATLNQMTFHEMHINPDSLCGHVLNPETPVKSSKFQKVLDNCTPSHENCEGTIWSDFEAKIIVLKFAKGADNDRIKGLCPEATDELIEAVALRAHVHLPFNARAENLKRIQLRKGEFPIGKKDLWKRVVFEYSEKDHLPQKQIFGRIEESAKYTKPPLTSGTLNVWISGHRLVNRLSKFIRNYNNIGGRFYE